MTEYIILVGALVLVGLGAFRIFGRGVQDTIARENESIANVDGRTTSEGSTQSSASSPSAESSTSSASNSASNSARRKGIVKPPDDESSSEAESEEKRSSWGVVLVIAGAVAILFLGLGRAKQSSSN